MRNDSTDELSPVPAGWAGSIVSKGICDGDILVLDDRGNAGGFCKA